MLVEDIVLVLFLVAAGLLYVYYLRRVKKPGAQKAQGRLARWLAVFGDAEHAPARPSVHQQRESTYAAELAAGLDEVYDEFIHEADAIRKEMNLRLDSLREELQKQVEEEVQRVVAAHSSRFNPEVQTPETFHRMMLTNGSRTATDSRDTHNHSQVNQAPRVKEEQAESPLSEVDSQSAHGVDEHYFEILDLLYQGIPPENIARSLQVDVHDVLKVQELLRRPGQRSPM